ncbi:MAG TPA: DUF6702 family protein [Gemmatimonadales bacterium]|nr:DUF6702 family protein [Gemmatimonadales bacterium]
MSRTGALALLLLGGAAHPLHTSITEMTADGREVRVSIRLYADDLRTAVGTTDALPSDSSVARYLRGHFALRDPADRPVRLRWGGLTRHDDAVVIRLEGMLPGGLAGAQVANVLLTERFRDQVNVVRASWPGGTATLLFTPGDDGKAVR